MALTQSLLDSGRLGLIAVGADRKIDSCQGKLVSALPIGSHASDVMPFLIGLDDGLDDVTHGRRPLLDFPRLVLHQGPLADKVLSFEIMPAESPGRLQILVRDESELAGLEQRVLQQRNELALANEALSEAKRQAEDALREKSSFLANVSHDLKTPLQVIMGNAEILRGNLPSEERQAFLRDIIDNADFLLSLITDLLDASALEADQLKLTDDVIDIRALLERVLSTARQMPEGKQRRFELSIDDGGHAILADPMRLQRLLLNLVSNAVKFTGDGGRIAVKAVPVRAGEFVIDVADDGCGIEPDMMERIFEPFTMGRTSEGSGLGLRIAKGLADLHGAELILSSELGTGTTASLRLPKSRVLKTPS